MTTSPRLGLTLPAGGDSMAAMGSLLTGNYNLIDAGIGGTYNAAAPAAYLGRIWYDSTNAETKTHNGSSFNAIQGANYVREQTNYDIQAVQQASTGSDVAVLTLTQNVISGKKYLVRYNTFMKWDKSPSGGIPFNYFFQLTFKDGASTTLHTRQIPFNSTVLGGPALGIDPVGFFEWIPGSTGSQSVTMFFKKGTGRSDATALINVGVASTNMAIERWRN